MAAMVDILVRIALNAAAFIVAVQVVPNVGWSGDLVKLGIIAAVFGVINGFLRPIVQLLSLPLKLLTFGLVGFIINVGLVILTALISERFSLGFTLAGWPPGEITLSSVVAAFLISIVVSVVATLVALLRKVVPGP